jgi:hypothetical protein
VLLPDRRLQARLMAAIDVEGKIPRALDDLGPIRGQRVLLLEAAPQGRLARRLRQLGGRVTTRRTFRLDPAPGGLFDVVVVPYAGFVGSGPATAERLEKAEALLAPGGRILAIQGYGRDDVSRLLADPEREAGLVAWSHRSGPLLTSGWRVRTLHCWWTFGSLHGATEFLARAFPSHGPAVAQGLRRPRLSFKVAVYHRSAA